MENNTEITVEQTRERLIQIMMNYSGKSETGYILRGNTIGIEGILNLLECSLSAQKEELDRLRKSAKQTAKKIEFLSQQPLI